VLAELLASGQYDRHLRLVRTRQRARHDGLLAALGLHLLVRFPGLDADDVAFARGGAGDISHHACPPTPRER
jgi:GntR family transcriptional regulator/MocR family aminotransferase